MKSGVPEKSPTVILGDGLGSLKSPQVQFGGDRAGHSLKHSRSTPTSGRGKLKKIRDGLRDKLAAQRLATASPSKIFAKSMLSFDLHAGPLHEDEVPGENELFVQFVTDRRRSSGRGTLRELINKRIALQTGAQALAQRQARAAPAPGAADPPKPTEPEKGKSKVRPDTKVNKKKAQPPSDEVTSRRVSDLEIPLAQDSISEPPVSQTQVLNPEWAMSQTQVLNPPDANGASFESPKAASQEIPFMSTPLVPPVRSAVESDRLETVVEEDESEEGTVYQDSEPEGPRERKERSRRVRNLFVDDEADESEDCLSGDEDEDEEDSDLSDLIASEPETQDDGCAHVALHQRWLMEQENQFQVGKSRDEGEVGNRRRRARPVVNPIAVLQQPVKAKPANRKPVSRAVEKALEQAPANTTFQVPKAQKGPPRPKKFPHRKSSVSSACSELDIRINNQILNKPRRRSGLFNFIAPPDAGLLQRAQDRAATKEAQEAKASAGSRLLGSSRFAFGNT